MSPKQIYLENSQKIFIQKFNKTVSHSFFCQEMVTYVQDVWVVIGLETGTGKLNSSCIHFQTYNLGKSTSQFPLSFAMS